MNKKHLLKYLKCSKRFFEIFFSNLNDKPTIHSNSFQFVLNFLDDVKKSGFIFARLETSVKRNLPDDQIEIYSQLIKDFKESKIEINRIGKHIQ